MTRSIQLTGLIEETCAGIRADQALARLFPEYSRARLKQWLVAGQCLINGQILKPKDKILGGEQVVISAENTTEVDWKPEDIALDIVYEDSDLIIINKPANLVVHPGAGNWTGTLVNALLNYAPELQGVPRAGIVHRIDKDTTGLLVVARNLSAHNHLIEQLANRSIKRIYATVVHGILLAGATIDLPISRHPIERKKMAVSETGREAITHYLVLEKFAKHTYLQVQLETGRTHQIRVHMAHIKHPIVGDKVYAPRYAHNFKRQALHAKSLTLIHPSTGNQISFEAQLPQDMQDLLSDLSK